ncbi:MAG: hypothetical protein J6X66_00980 [Lachnospiraceae bacterium]|nr:hypothetical protein [Lachnospiraceae bacterium]
MPDLDSGAFFASFDDAPVKAFHINTARISREAIEKWLTDQNDIKTTALPGGNGYIYSFDSDRSIGSLPLHHAGAVYSQDPSAMLTLSGIDITPDMRILDMCAAPGGKTSQLAMTVDGGSGFVLANEPVPARNRILVSNIERMGYRNVITSNLYPEDIAAAYPSYFDLVLVDAPCSGEGMFRKYPESTEQWSIENVAMCAERQRDILKCAVTALRPGGRLVYSTCTYAPEEDEDQLGFMTDTLGLEVCPAPKAVSENAYGTVPGAYRSYPHLYPGEGQFMAYLRKPAEVSESRISAKLPSGVEPVKGNDLKKLIEDTGDLFEGFDLYKYRDRFIIAPALPSYLPGKGITSLGVIAAYHDEKKNRLIPHHQFFSAYGAECGRQLNLDPEDPLIKQYLCGMEISCDKEFSKGYGSVSCLGVPIGGMRFAGGRLKNLYPKGLRETHL